MATTSARKEETKINSAINVTPMVDVMLVLLIIFMVIMPMIQPGRPAELAKTANPVDMPDANKADALIVAVMHDGRLFLGNESVTPESLGQRVKERLDKSSNKAVFLRADARARYQFVVNAVDDVRSAGVDQLGLLTEQRQPAIAK
ncbi:MAG TPA: biopolymer transporter ExbD [Candidatus Angelobacter sp.]|nr:biopolymer transporter ExbD [Candidatus Angelobacter sp.]